MGRVVSNAFAILCALASSKGIIAAIQGFCWRVAPKSLFAVTAEEQRAAD